jgi:hypothetical protein
LTAATGRSKKAIQPLAPPPLDKVWKYPRRSWKSTTYAGTWAGKSTTYAGSEAVFSRKTGRRGPVQALFRSRIRFRRRRFGRLYIREAQARPSPLPAPPLPAKADAKCPTRASASHDCTLTLLDGNASIKIQNIFSREIERAAERRWNACPNPATPVPTLACCRATG